MSKKKSNKILQSSSVFALIGLSLFSFSASAMVEPAEEGRTAIQPLAKHRVVPAEEGRTVRQHIELFEAFESLAKRGVAFVLGGYDPEEEAQANVNSLNPAMQVHQNRPAPEESNLENGNLRVHNNLLPYVEKEGLRIPEFRWGDQSQVAFKAAADRIQLHVERIGNGSCSRHYKHISRKIEFDAAEKIKVSFGLKLEQGNLKYIFLDQAGRKLLYKTSVSKDNADNITTLKVTPANGQTSIDFIIEASHDPTYSIYTLKNFQVFIK